MNKQKKHSTFSLSEIFDYLGLKTGKGKKHQLEREMQKDPFLADAVEGLSNVDNKRAKEDIEKINRKIRSREKRLSKPLFFAAASVAILIIAGASYLIVQRTFTDHQPSLLTIDETPAEKDSFETIIKDPITESDKIKDDKDELPNPESVPEPQGIQTQPDGKEDIPASSEEQMISDLEVIADNDIDENIHRIDAETLVIQEQNTPEAVASEMSALSERLQDTTINSPYASENKIAGEATPVMSTPLQREAEHTLRGFVIDKTNGEPIAGATIRLEGTNQGVTTGSNGEFSIIQHDSNDNTYIAQFIGMATEEFTPTGLQYQVIALDQELITLEEVVLTHQRSNLLLSGNRRDQAEGNQSEKQPFKPEPVVGFENYQKYLDENALVDNQIELYYQPVIVKFELNNQGQPINIQTISTTNNLLRQKAVNIIADGPLWTTPENPSDFNTEPVFIAFVFKHQD
jgi:hypothetical protein